MKTKVYKIISDQADEYVRGTPRRVQRLVQDLNGLGKRASFMKATRQEQLMLNRIEEDCYE